MLSNEARASLAERWRALQAENAMLRVVEGEAVVSAGLDYYDDLIRQEYPKDTCKVAALIGKVLSRPEIRVGDWLIAQRIRVLLEKGELAIVHEDPKRFYNTEITCTE